MVARLRNTSSTSYKLQIEDMLSHLETQGVKAIEEKRYDPSINDHEEWTINLTPKITKQ